MSENRNTLLFLVKFQPFFYITISVNYTIIDRTSLAEKSTRKDEKTLFWPPIISQNQREIKQRRND